MKKLDNILIYIFLISLIASCGKDEVETSPSTNIETIQIISAQTKLAVESNPITLVAIATNFNNQMVEDVTFEWISSNESVATVDNAGQLTTVGIGTTTISAITQGVIGTLDIEVQVINEIAIISSQTIFIPGHEPVTIHAQAKNAQGEVFQNVNFSWISSNENVAMVDDTGLLSVMDIGTASVSASAGGISASFDIAVEAVQEIKIIASQTELMLGTIMAPTFKLEAITTSEHAIPISNAAWSSNNRAVADVNSEGLISVISIGQTTITGSFDQFSMDVAVTVTPPSGSGDFVFTSDDTKLRAEIKVPSGNGPFPAVVFVHGSGTGPGATRSTLSGFADVFAARGIAVIYYDKRGVGSSGGVFFEVSTSTSGTQRIRQLSRDAIAGLEFLRLHTQIMADKVGLYGVSQGGWINPSAMSLSANVAFMVNTVGPVCTVGEEIFYSNLVTNGTSINNANAQVSGYSGPHGYDPVVDLEQIDRPSLWVLGGQDESIPTEVSVNRLNVLIGTGKPFEIQYHPNGNHSMVDVTNGTRIRYLTGPDGTTGAIGWILNVAN